MLTRNKFLMKIVTTFLFCYTLLVFNSCATTDVCDVFKYSNDHPVAAIRIKSILFFILLPTMNYQYQKIRDTLTNENL